MTDAGWHPDPHGRADRRYHDGAEWTAHITDAAGTTSVDPVGSGPAPAAPTAAPPGPAAPGLVIGTPPPRRASRAAPEPTAPLAPIEPPTAARPIVSPPADAGTRAPEPPTGEAATDARPALAKAPPEPEATSVIGPGGAAAEAPVPAHAAGNDATQFVGPAEVAAAAAAARSGELPADATQVTRAPADLLAAVGPPANAPRTPPGGSVAASPLPPVKPRAGLSPAGVLLSVVGLGIGAASLLALPWAKGAGTEASFLDLRDAVSASGPDISPIATSLMITGALFTLVVGGIVALARALGVTAARLVAVVAVVVGVAALALVGFSSTSIDTGDGPEAMPGASTTAPGAIPGDTLVDDGGAAVTNPDDGTLVTVPEADPTEALDATDASVGPAEDRLATAALVGAGLMTLTGVLAIVGLLVKGTAGHVLAAAGLAVGCLWTLGGVGVLATEDQVGDLGMGALGFVVATIALTVAAALPANPGRGR